MQKLDSGIYLLEIKLNEVESIKVGALGAHNFKAGYYYYIGSAQKNLKSRIDRHLRTEKKFYWHIDYLLLAAEIKNYYIFAADKSFECKLFNYLKTIETLKIPIDGFGSSDCRCISHLLYSKDKLDLQKYLNEIIKGQFISKTGVNN